MMVSLWWVHEFAGFLRLRLRYPARLGSRSSTLRPEKFKVVSADLISLDFRLANTQAITGLLQLLTIT